MAFFRKKREDAMKSRPQRRGRPLKTNTAKGLKKSTNVLNTGDNQHAKVDVGQGERRGVRHGRVVKRAVAKESAKPDSEKAAETKSVEQGKESSQLEHPPAVKRGRPPKS